MSIRAPFVLAAALAVTVLVKADQAPGYDQLVTLFNDFVAAERPPMKDGAPDYTAPANARRAPARSNCQSSSRR